VLQIVEALGTEVALDADTVPALDVRPEFGRDQVERFLVHRAGGDGVDGSAGGAGVALKAALEQRDHSRFAAADWAC